MTEWRPTKYLCIDEAGPVERHKWAYELMLPEPLSAWDVYATWEKERTLHMASCLKTGDILVDVGAERGWQSAVYAQMVGPGNVVLVEPARSAWPGIREIWSHNHGVNPMATFNGFMGCTHSDIGDSLAVDGWPNSSDGVMIDHLSYSYLHEHADCAPTSTIDFLADTVCGTPDAVTIDVEGAELEVLRGAEDSLFSGMMVWVSVHPELMERNYGCTRNDLLGFMGSMGYVGVLLGVDHEEHWFFDKVDVNGR